MSLPLENVRMLDLTRAAAGPIYSLDRVFADPQVVRQGMVETIDHPTIGKLDLLSSPMRMDAFEGRTVRRAPPLMGEHNRKVLAEYGFSVAEIADLEAASALAAEALEPT